MLLLKERNANSEYGFRPRINFRRWLLLKDHPHHALSGEDFADAVETLIVNARAKGLSDTTLLVEIEDIAGQLREALDGPPHGWRS
jgi:hypothetical protein